MNNKFPKSLTLQFWSCWAAAHAQVKMRSLAESLAECLARKSETIKEYKLPYST